MGGMGGGSGVHDPTVVAAFHSALLRGGLVVALLAAAVFVVWRVCRTAQLRRAAGSAAAAASAAAAGSAAAGDRPSAAPAGSAALDPAGRRVLRIGFGLLWIFDGILQGQSSMPLGLIPQVVRPAAASSPGWVRHVVDSGAAVWSYHPAAAAASAVWIQVGLGLFLLVSGAGTWSRLAGVASAGWGLVVWLFGEAFGAIFAPGLTWLFGAPGAALLYALAGVMVALPLGVWKSAALGRLVLRLVGLFFVGMAVLQAWPGRGFWQGHTAAGGTGALAGMVGDMAKMPQPLVLGSIVSGFAGFDAAHGWAVNLFAVIALAGIGAALASGRRAVMRWTLPVALVICLADWLLVEDLGFMGGVGTDPNSMVPLMLLLGGAYLAMARVPAEVAGISAVAVGYSWRQRLAAEPAYALRSAAALAAVGVTLVGAVPMAVAAASPGADPVLADAISGVAHTTWARGQTLQVPVLCGSTS